MDVSMQLLLQKFHSFSLSPARVGRKVRDLLMMMMMSVWSPVATRAAGGRGGGIALWWHLDGQAVLSTMSCSGELVRRCRRETFTGLPHQTVERMSHRVTAAGDGAIPRTLTSPTSVEGVWSAPIGPSPQFGLVLVEGGRERGRTGGGGRRGSGALSSRRGVCSSKVCLRRYLLSLGYDSPTLCSLEPSRGGGRGRVGRVLLAPRR